jgi:hypothetical protein
MQSMDFQNYQAQASGFTVDTVILEVIKKIASGDELAVLSSTLDAIQKLDPGDNRAQLFNQHSTKGNNGNFQTSIATETNGAVALRMSSYYFNTSDSVTNVLWFHFNKSSTDFKYVATGITLDESVYSQVRGDINTKLGSLAKSLVAGIQI